MFKSRFLIFTSSFIMMGLINEAKGSPVENPAESSCAANEFRCTDGQCIAEELSCDGVFHCKDSSDEDTRMCLARECPESWHKCDDSELCISTNKLCDGHADCPGGSDETNDACINKFKMQRRHDFDSQYGLFGNETNVHLI